MLVPAAFAPKCLLFDILHCWPVPFILMIHAKCLVPSLPLSLSALVAVLVQSCKVRLHHVPINPGVLPLITWIDRLHVVASEARLLVKEGLSLHK